MNKTSIIEKLLAQLQAELTQWEVVAKNSQEYATQGDIKSDGKYDTRGIEAGQLASAQMRRVEELTQEMELLRELPRRDFNYGEVVAIGALLYLEHNKVERPYFLSPLAGGHMLEVEGVTVMVISAFSPLGDAALGLHEGDEFELELAQGNRQYRINKLL